MPTALVRLASIVAPGKPACRVVLLLFALAAAYVGYDQMFYTSERVDERVHYPQVRTFVEGRWQLDPRLTSTPGYHALLALLARISGNVSLPAIRLYCLVFALLLGVVFYFLARKIAGDYASIRTAQFFFFPILFPFYFLVYTDVLSLLMLMVALLACLHRRDGLAGIFASLSLLVRQNNVVFLPLLILIAYVERHGWRVKFTAVRGHLIQCWTFVLGMISFMIFVLVNGGVAIGDRSSHPVTLSLGNLYFSLFSCLVLFLPMHLGNLVRIGDFIRRHWLITAVVVAAVGILVSQYQVTHPYNFDKHFLRSILLARLTPSGLGKTIYVLAITAAVLSLAVTRLLRPGAYLLYPFWVLSLLPLWLVEPRYYLPPFALLLLFREKQSPWLEVMTWALYVVGAAAIYLGHLRNAFFL